MAENVRELVDKLIALALNNPNAEEARSAAMKAVSLIQEHKLLDGPQRQTFNYGFTQAPFVPPPSREEREDLRQRVQDWIRQNPPQQAQQSQAGQQARYDATVTEWFGALLRNT